jgi:predicted nucleic acid-binding protein
VRRLTWTCHRVTSGTVADLLIDTDVFIDHLRGSAELKVGRNRLHYSVVTRAELFSGNSASDVSARLLAPFREIPVDRAIAERSGRIRRETGIRLPDALIAATALERGLTLTTRNRRDFGTVRGLRMRDPV